MGRSLSQAHQATRWWKTPALSTTTTMLSWPTWPSKTSSASIKSSSIIFTSSQRLLVWLGHWWPPCPTCNTKPWSIRDVLIKHFPSQISNLWNSKRWWACSMHSLHSECPPKQSKQRITPSCHSHLPHTLGSTNSLRPSRSRRAWRYLDRRGFQSHR